MANRPLSVKATFLLIQINALIWLVFGIIVAANAHPAISVPPVIRAIMAGLSLAGAGILVILFITLGKRKRSAYFVGLGAFAVTTLLTFFDDVGWLDLVFLLINLIPLVLLIKDRKWYLEPKKSNTT